VGPEFDTVIGSKKSSTGSAEELVVDGSTAIEGTLVKEGGQILGERGIVGGGGGLLQNVDAIGTPGIAADFGS
jgi:hypothetical protein